MAGKEYNGAGLHLHKRKDGGSQWLYRYTIYGRQREIGLSALRKVSLKQTRECATKWWSILHEARDPIKEHETMRNLYYLKDIAVDAFESRKAELKNDGKDGEWFAPLKLHILPK
ncbi:Arm DNA-binding domain-containing protein [Bartonella machadoae]|nr:Arm DNA-binding domain-containing protein [Bartonella machadoae]